jgi:hypothetical protein
MLLETKNKFPQWCEDIETNYKLLLSDDIDSFMCYVLQKELFNRECRYFINVNYKKINGVGEQMLYSTSDNIDWNNIIGLDIALENNVKCWDNHITRYSINDEYNRNSANMNVISNVCSYNYKSKFVVSSFITMLSYYNIDISTWNNEQLAVLSCIDGVYTPFLRSEFKGQGRKNLEVLGYGLLADFIEENLQYIVSIEYQYNLKSGKIWVDEDGLLKTNIDLLGLELLFNDVFKTSFSLPDHIFKPLETYKSTFVELGNKYTKQLLNKNDRLMNFALVFKNRAVISYNMN